MVLFGGGLFAMNNSSPTTHSNFVNNFAIVGNEIVTGFNENFFFQMVQNCYHY